MIGIVQAFAPTYARARTQFLEAAATASLPIESHRHPLLGRDGEDLAMDVVRDGPPDADKLLIVSSGCHGVEGFCGSGVQVFALHDDAWREQARAAGVAVLYVHALNPYGFSHLRRTTHENVDLNRNFQDFSKPLPVNAGYREIAALLLPEEWPPNADNQAAVQHYLATKGEAAWQAARAGVPVVLHEMRPKVGTDAHKTGGFAELVCSNSFRSDDADQSAVGLLHWEMRAAGSLIMATADRLLQNQVDIADAVRPFYGDAAADQLTTLLQEHITGAVAVLSAAKAGDSDALNQAVTAEYANATAIGDFLADANPANWDKADMEAMMTMHIDQTLVYATNMLQGDYAQAIANYGVAEAHMLEMADMLSAGVIAQFPDQFTA